MGPASTEPTVSTTAPSALSSAALGQDTANASGIPSGADQSSDDQSSNDQANAAPAVSAADALAQSKADAAQSEQELKLAIAEADNRTGKPASYIASPLPNRYMGQLLIQEGNNAAAIPYLQRAIELSDVADPRTGLPQTVEMRDPPHFLLAECYANLGNWKSAEEQAAAALAIDPIDDLARYKYAEWLQNEGAATKDKAKSRALLQQAEQQYAAYLLRQPNDAAAWYEIARVRVANVTDAHDLYVAGEYASTALQLDPNSAQIQREVNQIRGLMELARQQLLAASTRPSATQPAGAGLGATTQGAAAPGAVAPGAMPQGGMPAAPTPHSGAAAP